MTGFAVFLRGINVGGIVIRMADLRKTLSGLPVSRVSTILASGNVVCQADISGSQLKSAVEAALRDRFGYDAWVVVLTGGRLAEVAAACPYAADSAGIHAYVTFSSDPAALADLTAAAQDAGDNTVVTLGPEALAWTVAVGETLQSPISRLTTRPAFKSTTTTRNLRTVHRVMSALEA